jgi:hypothetical protein
MWEFLCFDETKSDTVPKGDNGANRGDWVKCWDVGVIEGLGGKVTC